MGRPPAAIILEESEKTELDHIVRSHTAENHMVLRFCIILICAERKTNMEIAFALGIDTDTVSKWRIRFSQKRIDNLLDAERPGKPPGITPDDRLKIIDTVVKPPEAETYWSLRDLSAEPGSIGVHVSKSELQKILSELDLEPHQYRIWLHSSDPDFEKKHADVIVLYMNPPENALIISVDEKTQMQVLSHDLRRPMKKGSPEQIDSHYHRHGVLSLYAALFVHSGKVVGKTEKRHSNTEFISFLEIIRNEVANEGGKGCSCDM